MNIAPPNFTIGQRVEAVTLRRVGKIRGFSFNGRAAAVQLDCGSKDDWPIIPLTELKIAEAE